MRPRAAGWRVSGWLVTTWAVLIGAPAHGRAEPFAELGGGLLTPLTRPALEPFATSPSLVCRAGLAAGDVAAEVGVSYARMRRVFDDTPLDQPVSPRYRVLAGGRLGARLGARARIQVRGALGLDRLHATYVTGAEPDSALGTFAVTRTALAVELGGGGQVDLGHLGGTTIAVGLQAGVAMSFRDDRSTYELEPLLTLSLRE